MILYPNCKINIGLRVVQKRADGYHDLETIFYPVKGLSDVLEVAKVDNAAQHISFACDGIAIDCAEEDNLIVRCYRLMVAHYPAVGSVDVHFTKRVPFGAGLGSGSSDAAHMAIALNELFALGLNQAQLAAEVRALGADCPFFIYNTPCFATGIGDILTPIDLDLSSMRLVIIKPDVHVSTRDAYAGITPCYSHALQDAVRSNSFSLLHDACTNDFETTVFARYPQLADIKKHLQDAGAFYAAMSGSGSAIYGLFKFDAESRTLAQLSRLHEEFASMVIFDDTLA